jgi:predicted secreted hydrolase
MGHAAVSDLDRKEHWFSEILYRENLYLGGFSSFPEPVIAWSLAPPGTDGQWTLKWNGQGFDFSAVDERQDLALNLSTQPLKPLVFQGPGGISPKSEDPGAASFYYSLTRLKTTGVITVGGETFSVSGESWMDKEFSSSLLSDDQVGWDWFSLQLRDGRDLMLFTLRGRQNQRDFSWATLISENGDPSYLGDQDWELTPVDWWRSPSGAQYPVRWNLSAARVGSFQIVPAFSDQENRSQLIPGLNYWEGAVDVIGSEGVVRGRGYVELTGYAEGGRLPL